MIPTPKLLDQVVQMIDKIQMDDRDTKGDLYEYLLSKIATAGTNGQFRTPRHIIKMMVEIMQPTQEDAVCDPACGSAGFLVATGEYIHDNHSCMLLAGISVSIGRSPLTACGDDERCNIICPINNEKLHFI